MSVDMSLGANIGFGGKEKGTLLPETGIAGEGKVSFWRRKRVKPAERMGRGRDGNRLNTHCFFRLPMPARKV